MIAFAFCATEIVVPGTIYRNIECNLWLHYEHRIHLTDSGENIHSQIFLLDFRIAFQQNMPSSPWLRNNKLRHLSFASVS
jgi:hypothetical protein